MNKKVLYTSLTALALASFTNVGLAEESTTSSTAPVATETSTTSSGTASAPATEASPGSSSDTASAPVIEASPATAPTTEEKPATEPPVSTTVRATENTPAEAPVLGTYDNPRPLEVRVTPYQDGSAVELTFVVRQAHNDLYLENNGRILNDRGQLVENYYSTPIRISRDQHEVTPYRLEVRDFADGVYHFEALYKEYDVENPYHRATASFRVANGKLAAEAPATVVEVKPSAPAAESKPSTPVPVETTKPSTPVETPAPSAPSVATKPSTPVVATKPSETATADFSAVAGTWRNSSGAVIVIKADGTYGDNGSRFEKINQRGNFWDLVPSGSAGGFAPTYIAVGQTSGPSDSSRERLLVSAGPSVTGPSSEEYYYRVAAASTQTPLPETPSGEPAKPSETAQSTSESSTPATADETLAKERNELLRALDKSSLTDQQKSALAVKYATAETAKDLAAVKAEVDSLSAPAPATKSDGSKASPAVTAAPKAEHKPVAPASSEAPKAAKADKLGLPKTGEAFSALSLIGFASLGLAGVFKRRSK